MESSMIITKFLCGKHEFVISYAYIYVEGLLIYALTSTAIAKLLKLAMD